MQVKLLRVIQEREIEPVGGDRSIPVDFRLICATKADLLDLADQGTFREDLYYRLNVIPLKLPTLAERKEDIPALVDFFANQKGDRENLALSAEHFEALMNHDWPGNVRELENVVERMLAMPNIKISDLFDNLLGKPEGVRANDDVGGFETAGGPPVPDMGPETDFRAYMKACEQRLLDWALARANYNISVAARLLGLPRSTLRSKLDKGRS